LLPFDGGTYTQAPFTDCNEEEFIKMSKLIKEVDLKQIKEERDTNNRIESISCSGGACEIV
jgi:ribonucleoside-diphosphate reductase alpha chain